MVDANVRQGILKGSARHADFCVYRTPDYMLSGLQDHRQGEIESSSHVAQVTLGQKMLEAPAQDSSAQQLAQQPAEQPAIVFWSCPLTSGEGSGLRPDYWSGHIALPRVVQVRNVLALTWRLPRYAWMTHAFLEPARFDEVRLEDGDGAGGETWAFARVGDGYVGIFASGGMRMGNEGQYAGRELICDARKVTWLVECGRAADWGNFDAFVSALREADLRVADETLTYQSPSVGTFVTGWDAVPTLDGEPIRLHDYPLVDSAWAQSEFGSGEMLIRYGDETYDLWFNQ